MGLKEDFTKLTYKLVRQHPGLKPVMPLYLLALIVTEYDSDNKISILQDIKRNGLRGLISPKVFSKTVGLNSVAIKKLPRDKFKEISQYLIKLCLEILGNLRRNTNILHERNIRVNHLIEGKNPAVREIKEIPSAKNFEFLTLLA